jgi:L-asparaginase / beta-aspartyl-peptidase
MFAIAVHGGAGTLKKDLMSESEELAHKEGLRNALQAGLSVLQTGGTSLDAVQAAVISLENCSLFNAGRGSVFNSEGKHEMDAAIMDGFTLNAGAVACVSHVKNPVALARLVLDEGDHVFLSGTKSEDFARTYGLEFEADDYFKTEFRYKEWKKQSEKPPAPKEEKFGTVGAVALDKNGHLAAATSTGGLTNKRYGRIGDSCIIGSGTYANDESCAVSCTGEGEKFIRAVAAHDVSCMVRYQKLTLEEACKNVLDRNRPEMQDSGGIIAIDPAGNIAMVFNNGGMYRACYRPDGNIEVEIF